MFSELQIRILVAACLLALAGCNPREPEAVLRADELVASFVSAKLGTEADVQQVVTNAAMSKRSIMFVNVDWAMMAPQRMQYAEFALAYRRKHPEDSVLFHYVDCTPVTNGYRPLRKLPGWQELRDAAGTSLVHGWGEVVWMERGRVLHVERIINFDTVSELIERTESLLPPENGEACSLGEARVESQ